MKRFFTLLIAVAVSASIGLFAFPLNDEGNKRVIYEQPEGQLKTYNRSGQYVYHYANPYGTISCGQQDGQTMDIVYADDGKVYLKNILCGSANSYYGSQYIDYWVEGHMNEDGTQIIVPLGQTIYINNNDEEVFLAFGHTYIAHDEDDYDLTYHNWEVDEDVTEAVYSIEGGIITLLGTYGSTAGDPTDEASYDGYGLGAYYNYYDDEDNCYYVYWDGFSEWNTVLTEEGYVPPVEPTEQTGAPTFNGYTTDGIHAYFVEIIPTEPSTIFYRVRFPDGTWSEWEEYIDILSFTGDGMYRVEAYAVAPGKLESDPIAYEFVVSPIAGLSEVANGKIVASQRYFNAAGQEMQEANGLTIVVTTYTDGTTSTAKVVK